MTSAAATERADVLHRELQRFIEIVVQQMDPACIILFGSVAAGQVHAWSDLDLVVVADTGLPFYERMKAIVHSVHPRVGMDVLVYTPAEWAKLKRERPFVQDEICGKGKVVYERAH